MDSKKMGSLFGKKKKGSEMSANEQTAKISVIKDLQHRASKAMSSKLHGIKAGNTMSTPSPEASFSGSGSHDAGPMESSMDTDGDMDTSPEASEEHADHSMKPIDQMTEDEVDHHLQKLMAHKAKLKGKH